MIVYLALRPFGWHVLLAVITIVFVLGVFAANWVIVKIGIDDPGVVVVDDWIGTWITLLPALMLWPALGYAAPLWLECTLAFVAFRITDILKPWPASGADRERHGGFGAMAEDAIAGIYSANRRVLGMMPHPEDLGDPLMGGEDGKPLFDSITAALAA